MKKEEKKYWSDYYKFLGLLKTNLNLNKLIKLLDKKPNKKKDYEIIEHIFNSCSKNKREYKDLIKKEYFVHQELHDELLSLLSDNFKVIKYENEIINDDVFNIFFGLTIYSSKINKKFYVVVQRALIGGDFTQLYCIKSFKDKKIANNYLLSLLKKIKKDKDL